MNLSRILRPTVARLARAVGLTAAPSPRGLETMIAPHARDRWMTPCLAHYTPDRIESILRSAASGDLRGQHEMFCLMEDTWDRLAKNLGELKGVIEEVELPIQAWSAEGMEPSPEAIRRKALLEEAIWHMEPDPTRNENDFVDTLKDLADGWGKGIAVLEINWELRESAMGRIVAPRSTHLVHPRYYGWPIGIGDELDQLMLRAGEIRGLGSTAEWIPFPDDKFLIGVAKHRSGHPTQTAMLRPLAWWWAAQNFTNEWLLNFCQLFGVPIRWATYDQTVTKGQQTKLEEMLEQMGHSGWGLFPQGVMLELKEAIKSTADSPSAQFKVIADKVCDLVVLGQTLTSDVGASGSRALGDVHKGVLTGRKRALINWLVRVINGQFIPSFCRQNFGDTRECPYLQSGYDEESDPKAMADRDAVLLDRGLPVPRSWVYQRHGIPQPKPGDDVFTAQKANPMNPQDPNAPPLPLPGLASAKGPDGQSTAMAKLGRKVLEDAQPVETKWLEGAVPFFTRLMAVASDPKSTEQDLELALARAITSLPEEVGSRLNRSALAQAMERNMGAAGVNGWLQGWMDRQRLR